MNKTVVCSVCGETIPTGDAFERDGEYYCEECHLAENCQTCPVCEEHFEPDGGDYFFITKKTSGITGKEVGLYRALIHPFFFGNCVEGFERFREGSIEKVNGLDIEDHIRKGYPFASEDDVTVATDIICPDCAAKYGSAQYTRP